MTKATTSFKDDIWASRRMFRAALLPLLVLNCAPSSKAFQTTNIGRLYQSRFHHGIFLSKDDMCGDGFYKQTGPDGDYCVFDYEAASEKFGTDQEHLVPDAEHYWEGLESQNKARKKFGLKPLTPEQYVALQAENHAIGAQQLSDATSAAFAQFDTNQDGEITLRELHDGLETILRKELTESSVQKVMEHFDVSGDGKLQQDEFVHLDELKQQIQAVAHEEHEQLMAAGGGTRQKDEPLGIFESFLQKIAFHFEDTCESNFDCDQPEVCCDFGYKKECCSSGKMAHDLQLEYATVPVPQGMQY